MAATATKKQNMTAQGYSYYCSIPRELCAVPGLTLSAILEGGFLSSFSGKEDRNGNVKSFSGKREELQKYVGGSLATLSRNSKQLKETGYVNRKGMSSYEFKRDKLKNDKTWNLPLELNTRLFEIKDEDGKTIAYRTLTRGERLTYAYFYTKLATVTHKTTTEAIYNKIAAELGIDPTTVSDAVSVLSRLGLLYCPEDWIGVNVHKKGRVGLVKRWGWFRKETQYRSNKGKKKSSKNLPKGLTEPLNRDKYYEDLQIIAKQKASDALDAARSYEHYRKLDDERKDVSALLRRAMISGNEDYRQVLSDKIKKLDLKRRTALENLGINPESLKPEYYAKCKKCGDTGWLKDGKACGCFGRARGAPPENGKQRTTKGTE